MNFNLRDLRKKYFFNDFFFFFVAMFKCLEAKPHILKLSHTHIFYE